MTPLTEIHSPHLHLTFEELCVCAAINEATMLDLVAHEIAVPVTGAQPTQWQFQVTCVTRVKKAARLYHDLDIDWADLSLVLNLLDEIDQLKNENHHLKQQLARFF